MAGHDEQEVEKMIQDKAMTTPDDTSPAGDGLREQIMSILLQEIRYVGKDGYRLPVKGKPVAADKITELVERLILSARRDENQRRLDQIIAWENRTPDPDEVTAASFGRAGAGMVEAAFKRSFEDRIAELEAKIKEGR